MKRLQEIGDKIRGSVVGDGNISISNVASIQEAGEGDITFLTRDSLARRLDECKASAVIVGKELAANQNVRNIVRNMIIVDNPALAYTEVAEMFDTPKLKEPGVSPLACVAEGAQVSPEAAIMPFVYVGNGSIIEKKVTVYPFTYIGENVTIGEETLIYSNVSLYSGVTIGKRVIIHAGSVLGSDGFGYTWDGARHRKIAQLGSLVIEDDVEIGANTAIDRGSLGKTFIGKGVKIDNLVQIAHNVTVGENSIIVSQVGIAGSSSLGRNVILAGQVGVRDHVTIGDNVKAGGGTGITKDVAAGSTIMGTPHMPHREWLRLQHYLKKLPDLFHRPGATATPARQAGGNPSSEHGEREKKLAQEERNDRD
jgi:UDP-3-O-[3-hydroxymyristoyl] glucosamine N-acyltransferase